MQTKTDYTKKIFKTKKRILRIRNKSFRRTLQIKRLRKKNYQIKDTLQFTQDSETASQSSIQGKRAE